MKNKYLFIFFLFGFFLSVKALYAQDFLEKKISIRISNQPIDQVLQRIGDLGGFSFSYSPDAVDVRKTVSITANNQSVREILNEIFKGKVVYKERRKYIILQSAPAEKEDALPENFNLNGYVIDEKTGEKLANASIYESVTLASTISNQYGFYKIRLPVSKTSLRLEVRKEDYIARSIPLPGRKDAYMPIGMNPDTLRPLEIQSLRINQRADSLHQLVTIPQYSYPKLDSTQIAEARRTDALRYENLKKTYITLQTEVQNAFASARQAINIRNITDTLHRPFQASVLPFLGTNGQLSGNVVNDISLNFLAGYSLGVNVFELGAFLNVVRGNVTGFQLAGIGNVVGNNVTGFQYGTMINLTLGNFTGFQGSNLINYTGRNFRGFQVAGVGNVVVGTLRGYQLGGIYNYAHTVESGHQIGAVNYANYSQTVPFGFFSFVRYGGYRRYEFGSNEFDRFSFNFKTGVSRFYNVFALGINGFSDQQQMGTIGYGLGTAQNLGKGWGLNIDLTANAVLFKGQEIDDVPAGLFRLSMSAEKKLGSRFAFFAGPSLNWYSASEPGHIDISDHLLRPTWLGKKPDNYAKSFGWVGIQAGIRFCNKM
ncbi:STN and carboxypeptidase regulatory-like domain-containing protein [Dyadobacter luteus]|uniref:STN and carboxypeptidase regulatory-like domain-containing protein n=1 Tax=Dyadobacter luteus TaxID=2259619 RepID=UPI001E37AC35|nr:STN and carboxypeptidase regulatory-like domain-containing protein [Dyadobacter luteus]